MALGVIGNALDAVGPVDALLAAEAQPEDLTRTHRGQAIAHAPVAVLALAAALVQLGVEPVDGGGIDPVERQPAEGRQQLLIGVAPVVDQGVGRDRAHRGAPLEPGLDEVGHGLAGGAAVLAGADLTDEAGLQLAGPRPCSPRYRSSGACGR
jgi:hypothetical protein